MYTISVLVTPRRAASKENGMSTSNRNSGKPWTPQELSMLADLAASNTPTRVIGIKLGRTEAAIYSKASEEDISLRPTNQSPYNRRGR